MKKPPTQGNSTGPGSIEGKASPAAKDLFPVVITALAVAWGLCWHVYGLQSFDLTSFSGRAIGPATMRAVDPVLRKELYFKLVGLFAVGLSAVFAVGLALLKGLERRGLLAVTAAERGALGWLGVFLVPSLVAQSFAGGMQGQVGALAGGMAGLWAVLALRLAPGALARRVAADWRWALVLLLIVDVSFAARVFGQGGTATLVAPLPWLAPAMAGLVVAAWLLAPLAGEAAPLARAAAPLALLPLALPLANEAQYFLSAWVIWPVKGIYAALVAALALGAGLTALLGRGRPCNAWSWLRNWHFPALIVGLGVFLLWRATDSFLAHDLLHPGNMVVSAQQFFQHGVVPFVDLWPARGLHDSLGAFLWGFVNGMGTGNVMDPMLWERLVPIINAVLVYAVLVYVVGPGPALLAVLFLPIGAAPQWTSIYYFMALLPVAMLPWVMDRFSFGRAAALWLAALFSFAYMPATGYMAVMGLVVVMAVLMLRGPWRRLIPAAGSFALVFGAAAVLYVALVALSGQDIIDTIGLILAYRTADFRIGGYPVIANGYTPESFWFYAVTPAVFTATIMLAAWRRLRGRELSPAMLIGLGLAACSLFGLLRGLARHSLLEMWSPLFLFLLLTAVPAMRPFGQKVSAKLWVLALATGFAVFLPRPSLPDSAFSFQMHHWAEARPPRVAVDLGETKSLVEFLRCNLRGEETFFEMINGYLLYALTGKRYPVFHHSFQMIQSEPPQEIYLRRLEELYQDKDLPLVVVSGPFWGANLDGIPGTLSGFRIGEWLYRNYIPYGDFGGYEVWAARNSRFVENGAPVLDVPCGGPVKPITRLEQRQYLLQLPYVWANLDPRGALGRCAPLAELARGLACGPGRDATLGLAEDFGHGRGNYLHVRAGSPRGGNLSGFLEAPGCTGIFSLHLRPSAAPVDYLVRISTLYAWALGPRSITITSDEPVVLESVRVLEAD